MPGKKAATKPAPVPKPSSNGVHRPAPPTVARAERILARGAKTPNAKSISDLVEKMRKDDAFQFGVSILKAIAKTAPITVEPDNPLDERATALAKSLEKLWENSLPDMLDALEYGRAAFERVYTWHWQTATHQVDSLTYLPFDHSELMLADGVFIGVKFGPRKDILLSADASWWLAINATPMEPHGKSIYLGAPYEVWKLRRDHDQREKVWYKRHAVGRGVARAPIELTQPTRSGQGDYAELSSAGQLIDPMVSLQTSLQNIEGGGDLILSSARDENGNYLYDYTPGADLKDGTAIENRRRMLDVMALRSLKIPERAITQDAVTGARATADAHIRVLNDVVEGFIVEMVQQFQEGIVDHAVAVNGVGPMVVNHRPIGDASEARVEEIVRSVLISGTLSPAVTYGLIDFVRMMESLGIPVGQNPEEALAKIQAASVQPAAPSFMSHRIDPVRELSLADRFRDACQERRRLIDEVGSA